MRAVVQMNLFFHVGFLIYVVFLYPTPPPFFLSVFFVYVFMCVYRVCIRVDFKNSNSSIINIVLVLYAAAHDKHLFAWTLQQKKPRDAEVQTRMTEDEALANLQDRDAEGNNKRTHTYIFIRETVRGADSDIPQTCVSRKYISILTQ